MGLSVGTGEIGLASVAGGAGMRWTSSRAEESADQSVKKVSYHMTDPSSPIALVTGASRGLGLALARGLAAKRLAHDYYRAGGGGAGSGPRRNWRNRPR